MSTLKTYCLSNKDRRQTLLLAILVVSLFLPIGACRPTGSDTPELLGWGLQSIQEDGPVTFDLDKIKERGRIIAIVDNSSTSYFIYRGQPMGYEYELLTRLADELDVDLEIKITTSIDEAFKMLDKGEGDLIAHNLTVTKSRQKRVAFTLHHNEVRQVLVQSKPANWRNMKVHEIEAGLIRNPLDLGNKEIYVKKNSAYLHRLRNLSEEIGEDILIVEGDEEEETESMIKKVANGEIKYTIADEDVAKLNAAYYPNLDVKTPISFSQKIAWGVRKNAPQLLEAVNKWILKMRKSTDYYVIYNKYFKNRSGMRLLAKSSYSTINGNQISPYDEAIKKAAEKVGWDWRLLAAMIYQESKFNPDAESWMGAVGMMQLMPETAEIFGAEDPTNPYQSIMAGASYLKWLDRFWTEEVPDEEERVKFILASYNVGQGHVADARELARKYGKDPKIWTDNVEFFLLQKAKPKYYSDKVVKLGYCRGSEPVKYVKDVMRRAERYKQLIVDEEEMPTAIAQAGIN